MVDDTTYAASLALTDPASLDDYDQTVRIAFLEAWGSRCHQQAIIGTTELVFQAAPEPVRSVHPMETGRSANTSAPAKGKRYQGRNRRYYHK